MPSKAPLCSPSTAMLTMKDLQELRELRENKGASNGTASKSSKAKTRKFQNAYQNAIKTMVDEESDESTDYEDLEDVDDNKPIQPSEYANQDYLLPVSASDRKYMIKHHFLLQKYNQVFEQTSKLRHRVYHVRKEIMYLRKMRRFLVNRLVQHGDDFNEWPLEVEDEDEPPENDVILQAHRAAYDASSVPSPKSSRKTKATVPPPAHFPPPPMEEDIKSDFFFNQDNHVDEVMPQENLLKHLLETPMAPTPLLHSPTPPPPTKTISPPPQPQSVSTLQIITPQPLQQVKPPPILLLPDSANANQNSMYPSIEQNPYRQPPTKKPARPRSNNKKKAPELSEEEARRIEIETTKKISSIIESVVTETQKKERKAQEARAAAAAGLALGQVPPPRHSPYVDRARTLSTSLANSSSVNYRAPGDNRLPVAVVPRNREVVGGPVRRLIGSPIPVSSRFIMGRDAVNSPYSRPPPPPSTAIPSTSIHPSPLLSIPTSNSLQPRFLDPNTVTSTKMMAEARARIGGAPPPSLNLITSPPKPRPTVLIKHSPIVTQERPQVPISCPPTSVSGVPQPPQSSPPLTSNHDIPFSGIQEQCNTSPGI